MTDLVSIITPSFNSSLYIKECITSVQNQSYTNWEMLIIDDFSSDNSVNLIQQISNEDSRIKLITLSSNVGAAEARNKAVKYSKGKYIAFLDSDDLWMPTKLEKQIKFMQSSKCAFSFTAYQPISEDGSQKFSVIDVPSKMHYHAYLKNTIIGCLTVVIDKEQTGNFRMQKPTLKDWETRNFGSTRQTPALADSLHHHVYRSTSTTSVEIGVEGFSDGRWGFHYSSGFGPGPETDY